MVLKTYKNWFRFYSPLLFLILKIESDSKTIRIKWKIKILFKFDSVKLCKFLVLVCIDLYWKYFFISFFCWKRNTYRGRLMCILLDAVGMLLNIRLFFYIRKFILNAIMDENLHSSILYFQGVFNEEREREYTMKHFGNGCINYSL